MQTSFKAPKVSLRPALKKDLGYFASITIKEFGKKPYKEDWRKTAAKALKWQLEHYPKLSFAITAGEKACGLAFGQEVHWEPEGKGCFLCVLVVDEKAQGHGIGQKALGELGKKLRGQGYRGIMLLTSRKGKAFGFYRKQGFRERSFVYMEKKL
jgi:ribosomal protein S18 acetylase RimI-like enzyme